MTPPAPDIPVTPSTDGGPSVDSTIQMIAAHATIRAVKRYLKACRVLGRLDRETTSDGVFQKWRALARLDFADAERHLIRTVLTWRKPEGWDAYRAEKRLWTPAGVVWRNWVYLVVPSPDAEALREGETDTDGSDVMRLVVIEGSAVRGLPDEPVDVEDAMRGVLHR
jgi:hypothetical protein